MRKCALCIGNDDYKGKNSLSYSVTDAEAIKNTLDDLGFTASSYSNLKRAEMVTTISDFVDTFTEYDVAVLYYAGHGFEIEGDNVLVPIDLDLQTSKNNYDICENSYKLSTLMNKFKNFPNILKIVIVDACRNYYNAKRSIRINGFAPIAAPKNSLIAFSTSSGQAAKEDSTIGHGKYTGVLLDLISSPRIHVESMFKEVRKELLHRCETTNSEMQISWEYSSLTEDFFFNSASMYDGFIYSHEAFHDKEFTDFSSSNVRDIVNDLRSCDFNRQNPACERIKKLVFDDLNSNELFVIGRNICQAANETSPRYSLGCKQYIENFRSIDIPHPAKEHILNGLAYEIYFDHSNQMREKFKIGNIVKIIEILETDEFSRCKNFIVSKISPFEDRLVYLPGQRSMISLDVILKKVGEYFYIDEIKHSGRIVFQKAYEIAEEGRCFMGRKTFEELKVEISKVLASPLMYVCLRHNGIEGIENDTTILYIPGLLKLSYELSVPVKKSTSSTGIAERGLQALISRKPVPCTLSKKSTE